MSGNQNNKEKPFRVLSIDGGGMRGVYAVAFLDALVAKAGSSHGSDEVDLGKGFDLIAGTSTGGIIAAGLAAGKTTSEILDFYKTYGERIFRVSTPPSTLGLLFWTLRNLFSPANKNKSLENALDSVFGDETLEELYNRRGIALCIPAIAMSDHSCSVFKTPHHPENILQRDNQMKVSDVCLATSAAPVILPIASIFDPIKQIHSSYIDGGLCANNPTLIALIEALMLAENRPIEIISIGTCPPAPGSVVKSHNRGIFGWKGGSKALEVSMDAQASLTSHTARILIENLRISDRVKLIRPQASSIPCEMIDKIGLDRASKEAIDSLIGLAHSDADKLRGVSSKQENPNNKILTAIFKDLPQKEK